MGKLIWHQWARLLAMTAAVSSLWAFFYRKFFWDFVGGTLGPTGLIPNSTAKVFNKVIIDVPLLQLMTLFLSMGTLALEYPLPQVKGTAAYRSHLVRISAYLTAAFTGFLVYQTFDCALYYLIAAMAYTRSMLLKETIGGADGAKRGESAA
ncbi:uncharacterized protein MKK02DRAFT_31096 [Dioszegia hungarica]|uniref:DUF7727 domain-containing protein n=1 Tax=Dioszegia hungarica TaxID=4972 RepID=A0AA38LWV5_9TREE|nr:uncharacterized protein MKK02DRAFT_31096 [Dioszegia hungarica]KAI9638775.1 hypothetical protein MKK02DRAFT_31096 [Dioszegia hungarica]